MSSTLNNVQHTPPTPKPENGIEELQPLYIASDFSTLAGRIIQQKCFRVEIGAGRHYRNEEGETFKSITTFLDSVMPPNYFLKTWRESKIEELGSVDAATQFVQSTADFGTGLHIATADYCRNGRVDWMKFNDWVFNYLISMDLKNHTLHAATEELTRDFAAIMAFLHEYEVQVTNSGAENFYDVQLVTVHWFDVFNGVTYAGDFDTASTSWTQPSIPGDDPSNGPGYTVWNEPDGRILPSAVSRCCSQCCEPCPDEPSPRTLPRCDPSPIRVLPP